MNINHQSVEIIEQAPGELGLYKIIEKAARVCYKSENKITDDSYKAIIEMLRKNEHLSTFEHGTVYLTAPILQIPTSVGYVSWIEKYEKNPYSRVTNTSGVAYVTTNYRVLVENDWLDDMQYISYPTFYHKRRVTVKFTADISVTREANRHRKNSMCEESTIYCNYSKDKFGGEITVNKPVWVSDEELSRAATIISCSVLDPTEQDIADAILNGDADNWGPVELWLAANTMAEYFYMKLIACGWKAKQARTILPLDTKSELIHTAFVDDWMHFFKLRCAEAHPQIKDLACKLRELFIQNQIIA